MMRMQDAVQHRVAQVDVAGGHVDLGAQHARAVRELAGFHAAEQVETLLDRAVAERRVLAGLGQGAAIDADVGLRLVVDIGEAALDQSLRPFIEPIEVVRGVTRLTGPIVAKPTHISLDGVDILLLFLGRIGVVEAQVAVARKFPGNSEIERDRLSVADMEVAVRFRRESGHDLFVFAGSEIRGDDVGNKAAPFLSRRRFCCRNLNVPAEPSGPSAKFAFLGQAPPATLVKAAKSLARTRSRNKHGLGDWIASAFESAASDWASACIEWPEFNGALVPCS